MEGHTVILSTRTDPARYQAWMPARLAKGSHRADQAVQTIFRPAHLTDKMALDVLKLDSPYLWQ